jgi:Holliday junction resolvase RusA-like endonuclease
VYKSAGYKAWEEEAYAALIDQRIPFSSYAHPMAITITQHARSTAGDVDNGIKCVLDLLRKSGVIYDDNRKIVKRVTVQDGARSKVPWIAVEIECLAS